MNLKIFLASFGLVFLAELGDKTQLTALAFSASSRSPWAVFIGTSLALVCSSAVAVIFGELLSRLLPPKVLHISCGVLFVLIGLFLLVNVARRAPADEKPTTDEEQTAGTTGLVSSFVLSQATAFEEDLAADLEASAEQLPNGTHREAIRALADEHRRHVEMLNQAGSLLHADPQAADAAATEAERTDHRVLDILEDAPPASEDVRDVLEHAVRRQERCGEFYLALSRMANVHEARDAFRQLAMEELEHAHALCQRVNHTPDLGDVTA